jgi:hypothetical protein
VAKKKRHSIAEIAAKLAEADVLTARGAAQHEIANTVGISVMTLHRWRKARLQATRSSKEPEAAPAAPLDPKRSKPNLASRVAELQLENTRLRRLLTDLLLKKMKLTNSLAISLCGASASLTGSVLSRLPEDIHDMWESTWAVVSAVV